tara:strand:+ start:11175 stop:13385 length:2211 start_codon:yes stop_codon:yes gene_type:complete
MKKYFFYPFIFLIFLIFFIFIYLSTAGYETNKLNNLVNIEAKKIDTNLNIDLEKILIKIDPKNFNLYLKTSNPQIIYQEVDVPVEEIKTYIKLIPLIKTHLVIEKVLIKTKVISIDQFKNFVRNSKPSNFKNFILNKFQNGIIKFDLDLKLSKDLKLIEYFVKGYGSDIKINILKDKSIENLDFNYEIKKNSGLIEIINGKADSIDIKNSNINYEIKKNNYKISAKIQTLTNLRNKEINEYFPNNNFKEYLNNNQIYLKADLNHNLNLSLNNSLKLVDYKYNIEGNILKSSIKFNKALSTNFLTEKIKDIIINNSKVLFTKTYNDKSFFNIKGKYLFNNSKKEYQKFEINNIISKSVIESNINIDLIDSLNIPVINYKKSENKVSKLKIKIKKNKNIFNIENLEYLHKDDFISFKNLKIINKNKSLHSFEEIKVKTNVNGILNNDFKISNKGKIKINGNFFDAKNLLKIIDKKNKNNFIKKISSKIEIKFNNVNTQFSKNLKNFNLFGEILNGSFVKINSKGDFKEGKYLEISLKNDEKNKKRYLEVYSDVPEALLLDYKFFKGIKGGKLLYTSEIGKQYTKSKLVIENFKVIEAPAFVKLLSLADLKGVADALNGNGLSFDKLEIKATNDEKVLKLDELYALGKSISILMEGYIESKSGLVSLKGTMVPAKMLNNFLSKIPIVGNILIPKEIGEGLFGISFKLKGLPGKIKTTVNPIKTLTPRFITKALENRKTK